MRLNSNFLYLLYNNLSELNNLDVLNDEKMNWTEEQVNNIAPDAASLKAGKGLAIPGKWNNIGVSDIALWGECQGSGANPYKTQIDFQDLAFKCSCPSRKFPCKHSIGILFLLVYKKDLFKSDSPPAWVEEWLKTRGEKKQKQEERKETKVEVSPEKKAKTEAKRMESVEAGLIELELWLKDITRNGINSLQKESYNYFANIASRMVDAKAPNLAKKIDQLSSITNSGNNWAEVFLEKISSIFLLLQGFKNIDSLPEELKDDIKTQIGWNYSQDELLKNDGVNDLWLVISQTFETENNLKIRKTYLLGSQTNKFAMLLDYSFGAKPFENIDILAGNNIYAELVYYPSTNPLRALLKARKDGNLEFIKNGYKNLNEIFSQYAEALAKNPFTEVIPAFLNEVIPIYHNEKFLIIDSEKNFINISKSFSNPWLLLSLSGGNSIDIFGEWNGKEFCPLSAFIDNKFYSLSGANL